MSIATKAMRNISRRKVRALLVIIALGLAMATIIAPPAEATANQASTIGLSQNLMNITTLKMKA